MEKLWRWEEKSYQQEKKRKILWTVAPICWVAALAVTYWVEHTLYGEVIETGTFTYLGVSIGMAIGQCLRAAKVVEPIAEAKRRKTNIVLTIFVVAFIIAMFYFGRVVVATQFICVVLVAYWMDYEAQQDVDKISLGAVTLFLASLMLVVGTFAGPKIMGLTSAKQAEKIVAEQGYEDVEYLGRLQGRWAYRDAVDKSFYTAEMSEEWLYMLEAKENGKPYRFLVDPKGGEILLAASKREEPELGNWYR